MRRVHRQSEVSIDGQKRVKLCQNNYLVDEGTSRYISRQFKDGRAQMNCLRARGQLSVYHSRKFDVAGSGNGGICRRETASSSQLTTQPPFTASTVVGPVLQGTIIKREIRQVIGEFRFECEEGARMGVPHQAFLILVSPNPLFYDLIKEGKGESVKLVRKGV